MDANQAIQIQNIQRALNRHMRSGLVDKQLIDRTLRDFDETDPSFLRAVAEQYLQDHPNYALIRKIVSSKVIVDVNNSRKAVLFDPATRSRTPIDRTILNTLFSTRHFDKSEVEIICKFEYNPFKPQILYQNEANFWCYNEFEPAAWQTDWFYSNGEQEIPSCSTVPPRLQKFLLHLVNNDINSYNYLLDWLAFGMRAKNFCYLVTVGDQGVGKGRLGDIMSYLYGPTNYYVGSDKMFKGRFNSHISNKRLVYCDEISLSKKEEQNRLKEVANALIEKEGKGVDAENVINYANFYISSNDYDGLPMTEEDRRFSVLELTDKKLRDIMPFSEIAKLDTDRKELDEFARFLYHREVEQQKMLHPLKTRRREEIIETSLPDWEKEFITVYRAKFQGEFRPMNMVQNELKELGCRHVPGHKAFKKTCKKYPDLFHYRQARKAEQSEWGPAFGVYTLREDETADKS